MKNRHGPKDTKALPPKVGIFFVVNGKLWVEGISWTEAASHAGFRTYEVDHPAYWEQLQARGAAPREGEYDRAARGRVNYEDASRKFTLFADRCILKNKSLLSKIMEELSLPKRTRVLPDEHYQCPDCVSRKPTKQQAKDWEF